MSVPSVLPESSWVVRSPNWLGDAIMATPALTNLKKWLGATALTVAAPAKLTAFWEACSFVDAVLPLTAPRQLWSCSRQLKAGRFTSSLLLTNSFRTALEARLAGIPQIVGFGGNGRDFLLSRVVSPRDFDFARLHQKYHYLHLIAALGASAVEPTAQLSTQLELSEIGTQSLIILCPGAEYGPAKRWPEDYFAILGQNLMGRSSAQILILGAPGDAAIGARLAQRIPGSKNLCGKTSLREFIDYLARARLVVSNDSGAMHLAALTGTPTVALFGSTEPRWTGPLGSSGRVLRKHVPCSPCFLRHCPLDFTCMKSLTPEIVLAACEDLLVSPRAHE